VISEEIGEATEKKISKEVLDETAGKTGKEIKGEGTGNAEKLVTKELGKVARVGITGEGIPLERVKPNVLEQIHPDENAAYGYLPNKGTDYDKPSFDFTKV
jgi:hypothetical protein